jgi:hypothetical protein
MGPIGYPAVTTPPGTAVLLLAFNRPQPTLRVLEAVAAARVQRLYVAVDGPRTDRSGESSRVSQVLELVGSRAWADEVHVRSRVENQGCRDGVVDGLDWFFAHEPEGIVLEDDCLPGADFFGFCRAMLDRYRTDGRVWMVSGDNLLGTWRPRRSDYFFGDGGIWGWASWRRAWQQRDISMELWTDPACRARAREFLGSVGWRALSPMYAEVAAGRIDTWDYQWSWTRACHGGLSVIPARNLVTNIGFGEEATHTREWHRSAALPTRRLPGTRGPGDVRFDHGYQMALAARDRLLSRLEAVARRARNLAGGR